MIKEMKLESKVSVYIVPNNKKYDQKRHGDGDEIQFRSYINFAAQLNTTFDLVLDDGRARVPVRCVGLRHLKKYASKSSILDAFSARLCLRVGSFRVTRAC